MSSYFFLISKSYGHINLRWTLNIDIAFIKHLNVVGISKMIIKHIHCIHVIFIQKYNVLSWVKYIMEKKICWCLIAPGYDIYYIFLGHCSLMLTVMQHCIDKLIIACWVVLRWTCMYRHLTLIILLFYCPCIKL